MQILFHIGDAIIPNKLVNNATKLRARGQCNTHLCWLSLTFMLTLAPLGVVGPKPLSHKSY